jgi:hypothetical protein
MPLHFCIEEGVLAIKPVSVFLKLEARFQIGVIRPIRVDHTDFFKWLLKLIHS